MPKLLHQHLVHLVEVVIRRGIRENTQDIDICLRDALVARAALQRGDKLRSLGVEAAIGARQFQALASAAFVYPLQFRVPFRTFGRG
jgi:hypothetical protein